MEVNIASKIERPCLQKQRNKQEIAAGLILLLFGAKHCI